MIAFRSEVNLFTYLIISKCTSYDRRYAIQQASLRFKYLSQSRRRCSSFVQIKFVLLHIFKISGTIFSDVDDLYGISKFIACILCTTVFYLFVQTLFFDEGKINKRYVMKRPGDINN